MPNPVQRWLLPLALMGLIAACSTPRQAAERFGNISVYGKNIRIEKVNDNRLPDGSLQVVVWGYSNSRHDRPTRYRALWTDSAGHPIRTTVSNWFPINLEGKRPFDLTMVGPGNRAVGYRVEIEVLEER